MERKQIEECYYQLLLYQKAGDIKKACLLIARYKIDVWDVTDWMGQTELPPELMNEKENCEKSLLEQLYEQMLQSDSSYEEYYEILVQYPCGEYAQLLILYARKEDRRTDAIAMSNLMKKTVQTRAARINHRSLYTCQMEINPAVILLSYYTDRLGDLSYIRDYQEIRKCVNEAVKLYRYEEEALRDFSPEWLPRFWINLFCCINILGRYDRTIELSRSITLRITDSDYYFYVAEAYYAVNDMEKARKFAKRSAALGTEQKNLLLLAQIYMTEHQYKEAERLLLQSIGMQSRVVEDHYMDNSGTRYGERTNTRELYEGEYRKKLESPYMLLFFCYVCEQDYMKARVFYEEIRETLGNSDRVRISAALLSVNEKVKGQLEQAEETRKKLHAQLEQVRQDNEQNRAILKQWTLLLVECQVGDEISDISEEYWNENVRDKMDQTIGKISSMLKKANADSYVQMEKQVREQFPQMPETARKFLASADQMYEVFKKNPIIDFAPVMVEYCKVIEVLLWDYLDRTGEYAEEIGQNTNQLKTLGTAAWAIGRGGSGKSLYSYQRDIAQINELRCESAHKEKSMEPDVKEVRKFIRESGLVRKLCS